MPIVFISRRSYSKGKEVAERTAQKLGYECIGRELLIETSQEFNVPEVKLIRAIENAPSILERFIYGKERYIAFVQDELLKHLKKDNVVYHGLAGHLLVKEVAHSLNVQILADMDDRVKNEMEREGISREKALKILKKDDEERRKWSKALYGIDLWDPGHYDLVIHIKKISVHDAVDIICDTVRKDCFKTTPESQKAIEDQALAAQVKVALINVKPDIDVSASDGIVQVRTRALASQERRLAQEMEGIAKSIPGVKELNVQVKLLDTPD